MIPRVQDLPRLLTSFERLPGSIKLDYEDFVVEEVPLYPLSGEGGHTYFLLEKRGLNTMQAIQDLAMSLDVPRMRFGYAGIKDARAVTRQWISCEGLDPARLSKFEMARLRIVEVTRHRNKLKLGHLRGNRFDIRVRNTEPLRHPEVKQALAQLAARGIPNYFGPQRFGLRGDNGAVGRALLQNEIGGALDLILGRAGHLDHGDIWHARKLYDEGQFETARNKWPGMFRDQRRALKALAETGNPKRALLAIDRTSLRFYISAYQSVLFNRVVARRMSEHGLERLLVGDLAFRHRGGAVFRVEDAEKEQPRADALEISPTGPLYGLRMTPAGGAAGEMEAAVLTEEQVELRTFSQPPHRTPGGRRPLRFPVSDATVELGADDRGSYLHLRFELPRGCYATSLLRELFTDAQEPDSAGESAAEPE